MDIDDLLAKADVDVSRLEPAPAGARHRDVILRILAAPVKPCTACGAPSPTARIIETPSGRRWVDLCRDHGLAVMPRSAPPALVRVIADLRAAAAAARLPLRVRTPGHAELMSVEPELRYHLTLTSAGRMVQQGWWGREATARTKFRDWIGEWGGIPQARVTLIDEETGTVLTAWPDSD